MHCTLGRAEHEASNYLEKSCYVMVGFCSCAISRTYLCVVTWPGLLSPKLIVNSVHLLQMLIAHSGQAES